MGYPRRLLVPPNTPGVYHCMSRCVRRAFLCGEDQVTGRSFAHRKQWVEDRIAALAGRFAVAVHAYAVMDNHLHVVLELDPQAAAAWPDEEVARRYLSVFPGKEGDAEALEPRIAPIVADPERLRTLRERLSSLSWFMRCLKEPIARWANREDDCTGRFWEGRFKCQALLDESAVLAAMVYVDLNPVRAGVADTPERSPHTSVARRAAHQPLHQPLRALAASINARPFDLTTAQYLELVDWTARTLHPGRRGTIPHNLPPILERMALRPAQWLRQVPATESHYWRAIGTAHSLIAHAQALGRRWVRGITFARRLDAHSPSPCPAPPSALDGT